MADLLNGIATGFDAGLKKSVKSDLEALAGFFRSLPDQTFKELTGTVERAVYGDPKSAPSLLRRISEWEQLNADERAALDRNLGAATKGELKKVYGELKKVRPGSLSKEHLLEAIRQTYGAATEQGGVEADASPVDVTEYVKQFVAIRSQLRTMEYSDILPALAPFRELPLPTLVALLSELGFHPERTVNGNVTALKQVLEGVKSHLVTAEHL